MDFEEHFNRELQEKSFVIVPVAWLNELMERQNSILQLLNQSNPISSNNCLADYISEKDAMKMLNKKTTWFWNMRDSRKLKAYKIGNTNYYMKINILELLENNYLNKKKQIK